MSQKPIGCVARTGEPCPESGTYEVQNQSMPTNPGTNSRHFKIDEKLPQLHGEDVTWKLVKYND